MGALLFEVKINHLHQREMIDSMVISGGIAMDDLFLLTEAQMRRIEPLFSIITRGPTG
jgi:hypothetical protein